jgi:hypothetical protein
MALAGGSAQISKNLSSNVDLSWTRYRLVHRASTLAFGRGLGFGTSTRIRGRADGKAASSTPFGSAAAVRDPAPARSRSGVGRALAGVAGGSAPTLDLYRRRGCDRRLRFLALSRRIESRGLESESGLIGERGGTSGKSAGVARYRVNDSNGSQLLADLRLQQFEGAGIRADNHDVVVSAARNCCPAATRCGSGDGHKANVPRFGASAT